MHALIGALGVAIAAYHLDEPFRRPQLKIVSTEPTDHKLKDEQAEVKSPAPLRFSVVQKWTLALVGV